MKSYPKVMTLGSTGTRDIFNGVVSVQEKIDGSQLRIILDGDDKVDLYSRGAMLYEGTKDKLFGPVVSELLTPDSTRVLYDAIPQGECPPVYVFGETLGKPKHNAITYDRTPQRNLVIFDVFSRGCWWTIDQIRAFATAIGCDAIPELLHGEGVTIDTLKSLHETESYLGGSKVEGVVVKNYSQFIVVGGTVVPLFVKYVRPEFREILSTQTQASKPGVLEYMQSFAAKPRWLKAIQHLAEAGVRTGSPKDIGPLIKMVQDDLVAEESDNIKEWLFHHYKKDLLRIATSGFPEWYKEYLMQETFGDQGENPCVSFGENANPGPQSP